MFSFLSTKSMKIKPTIMMIFFFIIAIVVGTILVLQYNFSHKLALEATQNSFDNISSKVVQKINRYDSNSEYFINLLEHVDGVDEYPKKDIKHKILPLLIKNIENAKYIYAIYVGHKNGDFYEIINLDISKGLRSKLNTPKKARWLMIKIINKDNKKVRYEISLDENLNILKKVIKSTTYNPAIRPWYKKAQQTNKVTKTQPYVFSNLKAPGVTYAKKLSKNSDVVIGLDISLESLVKLLSEQKLAKGSSSFLFRDKGEITAFYNKIIKSDKKNIDGYYPNVFIDNNSVKTSSTKVVQFKNKDYFKYTFLLESKYGFKEYLGIISPYDEVMKPFNDKILISLIISILIFIFIAIPMILYAVKLITKPILLIELENEKVQERRFDEVVKIDSFIFEIDDLSKSLVSMAESIKKYEESQKDLLDSFVKLIAGTIDTKSKYTGGHCNNVPELSRMIMQEASDAQYGEFKDFTIKNKDELRELNIAAWLHDCGKVTTPEYVVDKATKLETKYNRIHEIRTRFEVIYRDLIIKSLKKEIEGDDKSKIKEWLNIEHIKLYNHFELIAKVNMGTEFMNNDDKQSIQDISKTVWVRYFDNTLGISTDERSRLTNINMKLPVQEYLLSDKLEHIIPRENFNYEEYKKMKFKMDVPEHLYNLGEVYNLIIDKGTLTKEERFKINEHVVETIKMLEKLPFPDALKNIPAFAGAHHETMIGTGYPRQLTKDEMPLASRVIALADVFEALTAADRPYKEPKSLGEAIDILSNMVKDKHLDGDLFKLFLSTGIYKKYADKHLLPQQMDEVDIKQYL